MGGMSTTKTKTAQANKAAADKAVTDTEADFAKAISENHAAEGQVVLAKSNLDVKESNAKNGSPEDKIALQQAEAAYTKAQAEQDKTAANFETTHTAFEAAKTNQAMADADLKAAEARSAADTAAHTGGGSRGGGALTALVNSRRARW